MTPRTLNYCFIYTFNYDYHHSELCKLESRQIFDQEEKNKVLFSDIRVDPSISPFIRSRIAILSSSGDYSELLLIIKNEKIKIDGFKVEYVVLDGDSTERSVRFKKLRDIGFTIDGRPDFDTPWVTYAVCCHDNVWYFGILTKHHAGWLKHKKKPCSYSNSIGMKIAKTLVSMASKGNKTSQLLDACCGVGTVMLEACYAGIDIEGCDIKSNPCEFTRKNLTYYHYTANVYHSDIKDLDKQYDAAIIDLPYNLYSYSDDIILANIIESSSKLTSRIIIVSVSNIDILIKRAGLIISDRCTVEKRGRSQFTRNILVCEKICLN